jgi:hypothetical protein
MDRIPGGEGGGVLIRTGPHSTVNDYASLWTKKWSVGESQKPSEEGQLQANPHTQGGSNMVSSIFQDRNVEIKSLKASSAD